MAPAYVANWALGFRRPHRKQRESFDRRARGYRARSQSALLVPFTGVR